MTTPLQGNGDECCNNADKCQPPRQPNHPANERNVANKEQRNQEDVKQQIGTHLMITSVTLPLPLKKLTKFHDRCQQHPNV
ncbi:hypothetical protein O77CONTIG1_03616 [Leptolyngbya sp. O-77]|nr:hypothetical protein O77CONTIG1_03616 [Leptolyngbya sp. O-77]